ncbi:MAG: succinate--CoA ligase subunit beta [Proteobacteria bacterium]|nr:succinate--CoA ligase subunit beta [Pseudomonadota bacterium]
MNLHEFQGKELFAQYGLPVSNSKVIYEAEDAQKACRDIGGSKWVVKAQVHAGGRGKAGGVELVDTPEDAISFAKKWLGKRLVTYQTDEKGQLVNSVLIEECTDIAEELYLSAVVDRDSQRVVFIGSSEGGVNIEEVAKNSPEKIIYEPIDPLCGAQGFQARKIAKVLKLNNEQTKQFTPMLKNLMKLFIEKDLSLLEINPLVITSGGLLHCLDAKINIDSNAIYRQPEIAEMHDPSQEDPRKAFKIILDDPEVKVVLVNIFGGIVRCDLIAEGVLAAIEEVGVEIPVVVRLEGNNADLGSEILSKANIKIESINNLGDAAKKAVELAK